MLRLCHNDSREVMAHMCARGEMVDSVVTDPPYGLTSIVKRFGKDGAAPAKQGTDGAFARASRGFMGQQWDGTGIERDPEFWRLVLDVMKPGAYIAAFSSPRTGHRQACAMEDAGFVMHPFIGWLTGQGFPKAHAADKAIRKHLHDESARQAEEWEGWAYGAQALKPALEPIYIGQKPYAEKSGAANLLAHGIGAMNIAGCRPGDRHPANLVHDGSDVVMALFPESRGQLAAVGPENGDRSTVHCYGHYGPRPHTPPRNDAGSASRFFNALPPDRDPVFYQGKATAADRAGSVHPTVKPIALMRWLCRLLTPPGGIVLDPFAGSGTTGQAALDEGMRPILIERDPEHAAFIAHRFGVGYSAPRMRVTV